MGNRFRETERPGEVTLTTRDEVCLGVFGSRDNLLVCSCAGASARHWQNVGPERWFRRDGLENVRLVDTRPLS